METPQEFDLLNYLPIETQTYLFSFVTFTELAALRLTCKYWNENIWCFVVTIDPTSFRELIQHRIENTNFDYLDDIFSEPDPHLIERFKLKRYKLFHILFEKVSLCPRKVQQFTIENHSDFEVIKLEFISAMEKYPLFANQLRHLKIVDMDMESLKRIIDLCRSLKTLQIEYTSKSNFSIELSSCIELESLTLKNIYLTTNQIIDLSIHCKQLQKLTLEGGTLNPLTCSSNPYFFLPSNLTYLGFLNLNVVGSFVYSSTCTPLRNVFMNLKLFEVTGSVFFGNFQNKVFKTQFPGLDVVCSHLNDEDEDEDDDLDYPGLFDW
eukprot:TRINITY_DN623_c0_g1_i2.p1 TRINITY_DN623_c0_g1~~TRINITY_DN623_c0_g1_i2.p1  ORF type:complete len:322 (-),score=44.73 TRINITY_DN623_c0_g1_i2:69-1034(-)